MNRLGFSLVEIILSMSVFALLVIPIFQLLWASQNSSIINSSKIKALFLANGYLEEVKNIRNSGWLNLSDGHFIIGTNSSNNLQLMAITDVTNDSEKIGNFSRYLLIEPIYRDSDNKPTTVSENNTLDPSTKKVTAYVSWSGIFPSHLEQTIYLTRYKENMVKSWDTKAEFDQGTNTGTVVVNQDNGEVVLGAGGSGDWCSPDETKVVLTLEKNGVPKYLAAIEGKAFVGQGGNASGYPLQEINISNSDPPVATEERFLDGYKTNAIFIELNYVYMATDKDIAIVNLSNTPLSVIGYFDAAKPWSSVFARGNVGYATSGSKFYTFDLSSKSGRRNLLGSVTLSGSAKKIIVKDNHAYVAIDSANRQLEVVNVTNPASLSIAGGIDVSDQGGQDVFITGGASPRAYLVTHNSPTNPEVIILNITNPASPQKLNPSNPSQGTYEVGQMQPKGITVVTGNRLIVVGDQSASEEYQVVNVNDELNPIHCAGLNTSYDIYGVTSVLESDGDAYSYIISSDKKFRVIEGGPGGQYSASGIYESNTLDTNHSTAFNRFFASFSQPTSQTEIRFQVAVKDSISGFCSSVSFNTFDFVGPDGTSTTYFTSEDQISFNDDSLNYENPGQCFRFRAYLSTNEFSQTPILYQASVNYSP